MNVIRGVIALDVRKNYDAGLILGQKLGKLGEASSNCPELGSYQ